MHATRLRDLTEMWLQMWLVRYLHSVNLHRLVCDWRHCLIRRPFGASYCALRPGQRHRFLMNKTMASQPGWGENTHTHTYTHGMEESKQQTKNSLSLVKYCMHSPGKRAHFPPQKTKQIWRMLQHGLKSKTYLVLLHCVKFPTKPWRFSHKCKNPQSWLSAKRKKKKPPLLPVIKILALQSAKLYRDSSKKGGTVV